MARKRATELEWLKWFYQNADFGPASGDVLESLKQSFMDRKKVNLPEGYNISYDGETPIDREE